MALLQALISPGPQRALAQHLPEVLTREARPRPLTDAGLLLQRPSISPTGPSSRPSPLALPWPQV